MTVYWLPTLLITALMIAIPELAPRGTFFGVRVPENFRQNTQARRVVVRYWMFSAICGAMALIAEVVLGRTHRNLALLLPLLPLVGGISAWIAGRGRVLPFSVRSNERIASLRPDEPLPAWVWLAAPPYVAVAVCGAWLHANYWKIPQRFAVHWGLDGIANGWSSRTSLDVYRPLLVASISLTMLLVMSLAVFRFTRRSRTRRVTLAVQIGATWIVGYVFILVSLLPFYHPPFWMLLGPVLLFVGAMLGAFHWANSQPCDEVDDYISQPTAEEHWLGGIFYCNPDDPSAFVERRSGLGYTLNFGNRVAWILGAVYVGLAAAVLALALIH